MPWIKNDYGEEEFIPSTYEKEDLPTWNEVYNEFYKEKIYSFDRNNDQHYKLDFYNNQMKRRQVIIALIANQFNKMLNEDNNSLIEKELEEICKKFYNQELGEGWYYDSFRFGIVPIRDEENKGITEIANQLFLEDAYGEPPIYRLDIRSEDPGIDEEMAKKIEFTIDSGPTRIFVNTFFKNLSIKLVGQFIITKDFIDAKSKKKIISVDDETTEKMIEVLIRPFRTYFEGEAIGWKDENGKLLYETKQNLNPNFCTSGIDPAL